MTARRAYPSDVSDEEWALVAPYLTLLAGLHTVAFVILLLRRAADFAQVRYTL